MNAKKTDAVCKSIIRNIANKLGVEPKLITTKLLSEEDKEDLRNDALPLGVLELAIKIWMKAGMPDYAHGEMSDKTIAIDKNSAESEFIIPAINAPPKKHGEWELRKPFIKKA